MVTPPPSFAQIKNFKKNENTQIQIKTFMLYFFFRGARWILCAAEGILDYLIILIRESNPLYTFKV